MINECIIDTNNSIILNDFSLKNTQKINFNSKIYNDKYLNNISESLNMENIFDN